jgi:mycothiol synthase
LDGQVPDLDGPTATPRVHADVALDLPTRAQVLALADAAAAVDGVAPLSEQTLLRLGQPPSPLWRHLIARAGDSILGYAHLDAPGGANRSGPATPGGWAEVAVTPAARRRGVGAALLGAVLDADPGARVWAHGDLPAAAALAATRSLRPIRRLWQMALPFSAGQRFPAELPDGFAARTFDPADLAALAAVNARAFADHPEQGRLTVADLRERMSQSWFEAAGLFLAEDLGGSPAPRLAAFHWTKLDGGDGEVYVVGVDPEYQGRGLGRAVTELGLEHLRARGARRARLYVEGDNAAALATYRGLGFEVVAADVMYAARPGPDEVGLGAPR